MNNNDFFELATKILSRKESLRDRNLHLFLMRNEEYRKFFLWYKSKWNANLNSSGNKFSYSRGLDLLREKISDSDNNLPKRRTTQIRLNRKILQFAASVIIILGLGYLYYNIKNYSSIQTQDIAFVTNSTERGKRLQVELPDGSIVYLNSESTISYPQNFSKKERNILLTGEAFFEVVKDEKRPFIVRSGEIITTVLGTKFNVLNRPDNIFITLESGKVKVSQLNSKQEFFLDPGEQFCFDIVAGIKRKIKVESSLFTDWRNGILQFNEIKFYDAIKKIENWYNVEIKCNSEELLNRNIRGKYTNEELKTVLEDLEFMFDFNYEFVNDSAIIIDNN